MRTDFIDKFGITPREVADKYIGVEGQDYKIKGNEIVPKVCPFCQGGKNNDKETFAINLEDGAYNCKRQTCGVKGSFYELLVEFDEVDRDKNLLNHKGKGVNEASGRGQDYQQPDMSEVDLDLSDNILEWFDMRCISKETLSEWNIMEKDGAIAFPYYDKEGEDVVLVKYRTPNYDKEDKKIWQSGGGKHVLWGIDRLDTSKPLIITEGEIDALTLTEVGYDNVTSVPFGTKQYQWLDNNWELIDQFNEVILWMDKDKPGEETTRELIKRLGKWRAKNVTYNKYMDANRTLFEEGKEEVIEAVEGAEEQNIDGLHRVSDVESYDPTDQERVLSSVGLLNTYLKGYFKPSVSIWTGLSTSGKSTFVNQEAIEAISQGHKVLMYSDELFPPLLRYWMERQMCTPRFVEERQDEETNSQTYFVPKEYRQKMRAWYKDQLFIYDTDYQAEESSGGIDYTEKLVTANKLLNVFEYAVRRFGVDVFVIDNLMTINFDLGLNNRWDAQSQFMGMVKNFANEFGVHVHVVAHPRKSEGRIGLQDISGKMDIVNRVDNVMSVLRTDNMDEVPDSLKGHDTAITILKNRLHGTQEKTIGLKFNKPTNRIYQDKRDIKQVYGWVN